MFKLKKVTLFKNYVKIALRNLCHHKEYSLINVTGLAIGMACCLLIGLYIEDELSFDRYHEKAEQIYRLEPTVRMNDQETYFAVSSYKMGPALVNDFPEILQTVRFSIHPLTKSAYSRFSAIAPGWPSLSPAWDCSAWPRLQPNSAQKRSAFERPWGLQ